MDFDERYRAAVSRDPRFDGRFIVAVTSTGIYCRPSCPARTPRRDHVRFYETSAAAQDAGFRACKRCIPDAVPGSPEWNVRDDVAARAMRLIADGVVERAGVPGLAHRLGYSSRQLGRILTGSLGAGPLALSRASRAQSARVLLVSTDLPLTDVAFAAGFGSVRQFNDTVREVFDLTPSELRARARRRTSAARDGGAAATGQLLLELPYRSPADLSGLFAWFMPRAVPGIEIAEPDRYARTLRLPGGAGWFEVTPIVGRAAVRLRARVASLADVPVLVARVRRLFDLDADPRGIDDALRADPALRPRVEAVPGIRLPGCVDPHEMLVRAIVGQQISVASARTHLTRIADALGEPVDTGDPALTRLFPDAAALASGVRGVLTGPSAKTDTLGTVAADLASGALPLDVGDDAREQRARLTAYRGIGDWTAGYLAMRVLGAPDVLLTGDVALRTGARALGFADEVPSLIARAAPLAPWRSYLSLHLWRAAADASPAPSRTSRASSVAPATAAGITSTETIGTRNSA